MMCPLVPGGLGLIVARASLGAFHPDRCNHPKALSKILTDLRHTLKIQCGDYDLPL